MLKGIKIELYPTAEQMTEMNKLLGCARFVYNYCLDSKKKAYEENEESLGVSQLNKIINGLKKEEEHLWLKDAHSKVLQQSINNLMTAYSRFFKGESGFPNFKEKRNENKCRFPVDAISGVIGNRINLITKIKNVLFKCSPKDERYLNKRQGCIKSATLTHTCADRYILSLLVDYDYRKKIEPTTKSVGLDMGIKDFITTSDGEKHKNIKSIRSNENRLKRLQRSVSKKVKGSKNRNKARIKLAKKHEKISNTKEYYLHELVNKILLENQVIGIENLNVTGMMKNHHLAKAIQELSIGEFFRILQYKAGWQHKIVIKIGQWVASSKLCSDCGYKKKDLKLSDRTWVCPACGAIHDRDENAAINILREALRLYALLLEEEQIGLSKPEFTSVENGYVDDPVRNNSLKSARSLKQKSKPAKIANEAVV